VKAVVKTSHGPGHLELKDIARPVLKENEVLVQIIYAGLCGSDMHMYDWVSVSESAKKHFPGVFGHEYVGRVVETGRAALGLQVGDIVAGETHLPCGQCQMCRIGEQHNCQNYKFVLGSWVEYMAVPAVCAVKIPADLPLKLAAILEPCGVAVHALQAVDIRGESIAVVGCGPIGLAAIVFAGAMGAGKIFAVELNASRQAMAKNLGATVVYDPRSADVAEGVLAQTDGYGVTFVFDFSGSPAAVPAALLYTRRGGEVVIGGIPEKPLPIDAGLLIRREIGLQGIFGRHMFKTWRTMNSLLTSGRVNPASLLSLVTHVLPLAHFEKGIHLVKSLEAVKVLLEVTKEP
jgi:threonine 3-dehydrogenase